MMSPSYIEHLNNIFGSSLAQSANEINIWHEKLKQAYDKSKTNSGTNIHITVMEVYVLALYTIIAIATFFRGDFNSEYAAEKRLNLKYLCFVSTEFYKSLFIIKKPNTLWHKLESILSIGNHADLIEIIDEVNKASSRFRIGFFSSKRRDISLHYDTDLDVVYTHLCEISEEDEAKQISSLLAILQPLSLVCSLYLHSEYPNGSVVTTIQQENIILKKFRKELYEKIYELTGSNIQSFAECLDQNMKTYHLIDRPEVKDLLSADCHSRLSQFRECFKLGILLHYLYLDLGTAVRGYLRAENYYEQQLNVVRINVIIYEGYKKIFLPQGDNNQSLWVLYIKTPILGTASIENADEAKAIEHILQNYSTNKDIENIRHHYSHFRKGKKLSIMDLWSDIIAINPITELSKALDFLKLLGRIIRLNQPCLEYFAQKEHVTNQQKLTAPLDDIFTKAISSRRNIEDKEKLLYLKNDIRNMILETFDKITKAIKVNKDE